jgi:hypothetical protein
MFIPDPGSPDFNPSRIPDPAKATKEEVGKIRRPTFFVAINFKIFKIILFLDWWGKKLEQIYITKNYTKKLSLNS